MGLPGPGQGHSHPDRLRLVFKPDLRARDEDQSYHCWAEFYAPGLGWIHHDVSVADLYHGDYPINADNERLVRLTSADGTLWQRSSEGQLLLR